MDQAVKKVKRKDYRIECFKKALLGVKKAHLFRMQKAVRNLRKVRKISEKPLPDDLNEEEREKKTSEINKTIQKFEKQIKRLDRISKRDMRIVALYMLKKDFEVSFEKEKAFFEKAAPGFEELIEQMEKESGEKSDCKWFYSLILKTKPVQQAQDTVRDVLGKVGKVKDRSKNKRKTKKSRAIERKRLKELGIVDEQPESTQDVEIDIGGSEQDEGGKDYDSLEDMVSIDYGSDAEMDFDKNNFEEVEEEKVPPPKVHKDKKVTNSSKNQQEGQNNTKKPHFERKTDNSSEKFSKTAAVPQQQQNQLPSFKEKVHYNRERNGSDHQENRKYGNERNFTRDQRQSDTRKDFGSFKSRGPREDFKGRQNDFQKYDDDDAQPGFKKNYTTYESKPRDKPSNFRPAPPNYHPSWQARLEQRTEEFIAPFQGKKIKL